MRNNRDLQNTRNLSAIQPFLLLGIIVLMIGAQAVLVPGSVTMGQMLLVSRQASALGIIALGQAVVVLVGGIDLSVGSVVMITNVFCIAQMAGSDALAGQGPGCVPAHCAGHRRRERRGRAGA